MRSSILLIFACVFLMVALTKGQGQRSNRARQLAKISNGVGNRNKIANGTARKTNKTNKNKKGKSTKNKGYGKKRNKKNGRKGRLTKLTGKKTVVKSTGLFGSSGITSALLGGGNKLTGLVNSLVGRGGFFGQGSRMLAQIVRLYKAQL